MHHNHIRTIILSILLLIGCSQEKDTFTLPLSIGNVWYYDVKGFLSAERYAPRRPEVLDSLTEQAKEIPKRETIKVYVEAIRKLGKDSTLFRLSEGFVRFWGTEILLVEDGYKRLFQHAGSAYLIKFPIQEHQNWENKFLLIFL